MKPHSLATIDLHNRPTPAQRLEKAGWAGRHGLHWPKGTVLPETQIVSCPRVRVADLPEGFLKPKHIAHLEQNQKIASCCRHPENHEIEGRKSHPAETVTDIYVFYCKCGKKHRFFCTNEVDYRPEWKAD